jgi:hypothetical protein
MLDFEKKMHDLVGRKCWLSVVLLCTLLWAHLPQTQSQSLLTDNAKPQISVRIYSDRVRFQPEEDVRLRVEIWNESRQDLFVFKEIDNTFSNSLAKIQLTLYNENQAIVPTVASVVDSFSSERSTYPPLATELPRYWIALMPGHFCGGEVVIRASSFGKLKEPGRYRIQGMYSSRGFLAQDINNPLLHYARELKQLPYEAWVGHVETNSLTIEVLK